MRTGPLRTDASAQAVFQEAVREARSTRPSRLRGAHVVLAVARMEHGTAIGALEAMGIDRAALADAARAELAGHAGLSGSEVMSARVSAIALLVLLAATAVVLVLGAVDAFPRGLVAGALLVAAFLAAGEAVRRRGRVRAAFLGASLLLLVAAIVLTFTGGLILETLGGASCARWWARRSPRACSPRGCTCRPASLPSTRS